MEKEDYAEELANAEMDILKRNQISSNGRIFVGRLKDGTRYITVVSADDGLIRVASSVVKKRDLKRLEKLWHIKIKVLK